jgi:S-adenosylmethionine:tRNA ribosyltransferase-isomerase
LNPLNIESYSYELPPRLIASSPANPKDHCKLLVYDRKKDKIIHERFYNILNYIPKECAILLNDTKVIKARIYGQKQSGGKIELLLNSPLENDYFLVYIRGKVKVDAKLFFDMGLSAIVKRLNDDGTRVVRFFINDTVLNFETLNSILEKIGHIPLPPYIKREDTKEDEKNYQTLFAKNIGAVAAPTASLHFSDKLLEDLKQKYQTGFLTLHVGAGTFKPVEVDNILEHKMHSEFYSIPKETCDIINSKKDILAVGTTVTRTVEYYIREKKCISNADIFIHPKNPPLRVNHLLTNFHLPKSTLLMLVASFIGVEKTLEIYNIAIKNEYRFFSYGDAMLII